MHQKNKPDCITQNTIIMNKEQILNSIKTMAASQGFYGRLYERLTDGSDEANESMDMLESQNFKDIVDLVLFIESCR